MRTRLALALIAVSPVLVSTARGDDTSISNTVTKYSATVNSFPYYQCKFTRTEGHGTVSGSDHLVAWKTKSNAPCRYAVDGEYEGYEQRGDWRPDPAKASGPGGLRTVTVEGVLLEKSIRGDAGLGQFSDLFSQMMLDRKLEHTPVYATPLDFRFGHRRVHGPDRLLARPEAYNASDLGMKEIDGRKCVGHRFVSVQTKLATDMWFDQEHGMIPYLQDVVCENGETDRCVVTAVRQASGGRWFPERLVVYSVGGSYDRVVELVVTDLDADRRPTNDDLSVTLPAGTTIFDPDGGAYFKLRQDEKVSGRDLPELFAKTAEAKTNKKMDTALKHTGTQQSLWFWVCGGGGLVLVLTGGLLWWRRRVKVRRAAPPSAPV